MIALRLDIVVDEGSAHRVIGPTVHIATVGALAVGLLVQLEGGIGTDVLDVLVALRLAKAPRVIGVGATRSRGARVAAHGQVLLVAVLLVLQIGQRR